MNNQGLYSHNNAIQVFRFLAFLSVYSIHLWGGIVFPTMALAHPINLIRLTQFGVSFFIILSGFMYGINIKNNNALGMFSFCLKRIKKFYPLHIITLAVMLIPQLPSMISDSYLRFYWSKRLVINVLLLQSWFPTGYYDFNGVAWFLSVTVFLSLVSRPLGRFAMRLCEKSSNLFIICVLIILTGINICYSICINTVFSGMYNEWLIYIFPLSRVVEYTSGIMMGAFVLEKKIQPNIATKIELLILGFVIIYTYVMFKINIVDYLCRSSVWIIPSCLLIGFFWMSHGKVSNLIGNSLFAKMGNISFEAFLIHFPLISISQRVISSANGIFFCIFMYVYILILSLAISWAVHK